MFRGYLMFEYLKEWIRTKEKEENEIVDRFLLDFELENLDNYLFKGIIYTFSKNEQLKYWDKDIYELIDRKILEIEQSIGKNKFLEILVDNIELLSTAYEKLLDIEVRMGLMKKFTSSEELRAKFFSINIYNDLLNSSYSNILKLFIRFQGEIEGKDLSQRYLTPQIECLRKRNYGKLTELSDSDIRNSISHGAVDVINNKIEFIYRKGEKYERIEARVIAWLAGEAWREELFKKGGDIYCMSASQMFGVPVVKHGINGELRQKGKIAELACGYGGSVGALTAMGALEMGLKEDELKPLVLSWREANQNIVALWWAVDKAIKDAIVMKGLTRTHGIEFECRSGLLRITLPSGRKLTYIKPKIEINKFGGESVTYEGVGVAKKWERIESYGPKFVENIVQAISRDILMFSLQNLSVYNIVAHVHDEIIIEASEDTKLEDICETMSRVPYWAKGLILTADGYTCEFYMKD